MAQNTLKKNALQVYGLPPLTRCGYKIKALIWADGNITPLIKDFPLNVPPPPIRQFSFFILLFQIFLSTMLLLCPQILLNFY